MPDKIISQQKEKRDSRSYSELQRLLVKVDRKVRSDPVFGKTARRGIARLEEEIKEQADCENQLNLLVKEGCDRAELLWLLATSSGEPTPDRLEDMVGLSPRQLKSLVMLLRLCAGRIARLNQNSDLGKFFSKARILVPLRLPGFLDSVALQLELISAIRYSWYANIARERLLNYVRRCTNKLHDEAISTLVAVAGNRPKYSIDAHTRWRGRSAQWRKKVSLPPGIFSDSNTMLLLEEILRACISGPLIRLSRETAPATDSDSRLSPSR